MKTNPKETANNLWVMLTLDFEGVKVVVTPSEEVDAETRFHRVVEIRANHGMEEAAAHILLDRTVYLWRIDGTVHLVKYMRDYLERNGHTIGLDHIYDPANV